MRCVSFLWFLLSNENPYSETPYQKSSSKPPPVSVTEDVDEISTISVNTCTKAINGFESEMLSGAHTESQAMRISSADTTAVPASSFCSPLFAAGTPGAELGPAAISFMAVFPISFA